MATPGEGNHPSDDGAPQPVEELQQLESRVARRRLSQARHRATLTGLFNNLRKTVYSQSDLTASKWQVLNKTKIHIQELEQTLDNLLKLKGSYNLEDGNASTLEEVKEEYARMYSEDDSVFLSSFPQNSSPPWYPTEAVGKDAEEGAHDEEREEDGRQEEEEEEKKVDLSQISAALLPDLLEFERYLNFYKQMMDLLTMNSIISPQEVTLPIVSAAISHMWQTLSEEKKACLLQAWEQQNRTFSDLTEACLELACAEESVKDSGVDSQGASCSLESTQEEILFEDAFDVAGFLDSSETQHMPNISSVFPNCNPENPEEKFQLYLQIIEFFKSLCCTNTAQSQEPDPLADDDLMLLKCLETFDDDDL
ncbi:stimulated by retinoic acid gene 8 protein homolog isoform X1 [Arvicola amphibius]|uniref:stimulated by retinoic acid gene 8 protein homolog isoform X1 n=1 Tax=Arvicola amphibius TaxID=1047088 RepID=UPI001C0A1717|nr:stimulated by retinoic acid gene 8 protein homolog isoform X1 [Arvicola amphibius]